MEAFEGPAFVCKVAAGISIQHDAVNELVTRAVSAATIPSTKEPRGLCRSDGKMPDGLTLVRGRAVDLLFGSSQWSSPDSCFAMAYI